MTGPAKCGTRSGLYRHWKRREIACGPCLKADADYHRERYRTKRQKNV